MQNISNLPIKDRLSAAEPAKAKLALAAAPERRLLNRELSLIDFFRQVLSEAHAARNPLLERLRFLTIYSNIVDEFFMVRVSGLKEEVEHGWMQPSLDGMTAAEQLHEIRNRLEPMTVEQTRCWQRRSCLVGPTGNRGHRLPISVEVERDDGRRTIILRRQVLPVLTPLARRIRRIRSRTYSGLSLNLGLMVRLKMTRNPFVRLRFRPCRLAWSRLATKQNCIFK